MFKYQTPPKPIADIVDAPRMPGFAISPDGRQFALMALPGLPGIEEVAGPELRLAGLRIDPRTNGPSRITHYRGITLVDIATRRERDVESLPADLRLGTVSFSPDGKHIVCTHTTAQGIELWKIDVDGAIASRLADVHVNDTYGPRHPAVAWLSDSEHVLCRIVPRERGAPPVPSTVPVGPVVDESAGVRAAARTYQDLLHDPDDEALFEHYATSMLVKISLEGAVHEIVGPGLLRAASPSPNARFVLIDRLERPFSYLVPHDRFATRVELWTVNGERVRELAALPLAENVPIGMEAVRTGPRRFGWRPDRDNELNWVEALDGGDPRATAERRDRIYRSDATEESEHTIMAELALRFRAMQWSESGFALVSERWWGDRRERVSLVDPDDPTSDPRVLWDRSFEDRYNDPGRPLTIPNARGCPVLAMDRTGAYLFLVGEGASPDGDRPFLDRFALASGGSERLWRSSPPRYETCVRLLSPDTGEFMTTVESPDEPPNLALRKVGEDDSVALTAFPHPYPHMKGAYKEILRYNREDGTALTATLYLPPGRRPEDGPFPTLLWAYPREFKDADAAGQMRGSPHRFNHIPPGGPLPLLAMGYAILDGPTMPIVGAGDEEPNDTYVDQLVASARAAVDEIVKRGIADRRQIAAAGHSYGGFMTANLLAHTDLFAAGIARSGAYNRTLTPFGFQMEERTYWEAPDVYRRMSPFDHAHEIEAPMLLVHGEADNNPGTFPVQSERFYAALKGLGAVARFVKLPAESHGYQARESVMHAQWEMYQWLERHVRQRAPEEEKEEEKAP